MHRNYVIIVTWPSIMSKLTLSRWYISRGEYKFFIRVNGNNASVFAASAFPWVTVEIEWNANFTNSTFGSNEGNSQQLKFFLSLLILLQRRWNENSKWNAKNSTSLSIELCLFGTPSKLYDIKGNCFRNGLIPSISVRTFLHITCVFFHGICPIINFFHKMS